jgi:hypothetical protein
MSSWPPLPPPPAAKPRKGLGIKIAIFVALLAVISGGLIWKAGKSTYRNYQIASGAVDHFHEQLNAGDYSQIYQNAADEFRRWGSQEDLNKLFANVRDKMGAAGKPSTAGFHVNWRNGAVWVDQTFNTQFAKGQAQEFFVWKIQQDQPRLYRYRIDSPNLHNLNPAK